MRLSYALLVAVATFLVSSDAASTTGHSRVSSTTTNAVNRLHPTSRRHLRSYNMNDLEAEDEERFQIKLTKADLKKLKQMLQVQIQSQTFNVDEVLRRLTREHELQQITSYFAGSNGILGGWLHKSTLDGLLGSTMTHKRAVFAEWKSQGISLENLTDLLNGNSFVKKEYAGVSTMYKFFLQMPPRSA
ncbi:hypothetical protein PR003_g1998 [Phytophthora rubi]|uniref:RxLR effector protein n=1 Tax=Phytophthora rubi TaxID=129364 RepID=A0A6A4FZJ2_9STRA|nr:hypothetical protein PR003_g1998 [Phytophthora rubi]